MTLADYDFYTDEYLGTTLTSDNFDKYAEIADFALKKMSQNREVVDQYERAYNLAVCELADYYYNNELVKNKDITSERVGSYSVNYQVQQGKDFDLAMRYLGNSGLLNVAVIDL